MWLAGWYWLVVSLNGARDMEMDMADTVVLHHKSVWLAGVEIREEVYSDKYSVRFFTTVVNGADCDHKVIEMGKDSAIVAARAILKHFNEGMGE